MGDRSITFPLVSRLSPEVERRRRLVTRTLPLALIAVIAFVVGAAMGAPGSPQKEAASRFAEAWASGDFAAMYEELNESSQAAVSLKDFTAAYREAEQVATLKSLDTGLRPGPDLARRQDAWCRCR